MAQHCKPQALLAQPSRAAYAALALSSRQKPRFLPASTKPGLRAASAALI
jgi:hypothetical protein